MRCVMSELEKIKKTNDIKKLSEQEKKKLAKELRHFLVQAVSENGGHLSSNLGIVELTIALHDFLDFPEDKLIWDVGHQSYVHKILTGRKEKFKKLRKMDGISGFPRTRESACDLFDTGHASTSISLALGLAKARDLAGRRERIVAVIGDGALTGGMAFEALNNAAKLKSNMIIVLNDNQMSIAPNVGGMANYLGRIRTNTAYQDLKVRVKKILERFPKSGQRLIKKIHRSKDSVKRLLLTGVLFEDMGITYIGPIDGHNMEQMRQAFESASHLNKAVLVHVVTTKGKGYKLAERNPSYFHGVAPFYIRTGKLKKKSGEPGYTQLFQETLLELAEENPKITAITAAMPQGTGLYAFAKEYPERFFDVGIAEEHAVTFAAGLAKGGFHPFVAIYSTFLQRAYDQILHDVCINRLAVTFAIDRAGLVGEDGKTHQGCFDLSFLTSLPEMTVMAPKNGEELREMLRFAADLKAPSAIRYPRGKAFTGLSLYNEPVVLGRAEVIGRERDILLLAVGSMVETAMEVRELLKKEHYHVSLVNVRFVKPFDKRLYAELLKTHSVVVTMEENVKTGGFGEQFAAWMLEAGFTKKVYFNFSIPDTFVEQGSVDLLKKQLGLHAMQIKNRIVERL